MIDKSGCLVISARKLLKNTPILNKKIRNCNEFENSLNFKGLGVLINLALKQIEQSVSCLIRT